eukprot:SAG31_NODE_10535_length_1127_cov_1.315175_1_plen_331_part_10
MRSSVTALLLGYGLAELPRALWRRGDLDATFRSVAITAVDRYYAASDTKLELQATIADLIGRTAACPANMKPQMEHIVKVELETCDFTQQILKVRCHSWLHQLQPVGALPNDLCMQDVQRDPSRYASIGGARRRKDKTGQVNESELAKLRRRLKRCINNHSRALSRWHGLQHAAFGLEDVLNHRSAGRPTMHHPHPKPINADDVFDVVLGSGEAGGVAGWRQLRKLPPRTKPTLQLLDWCAWKWQSRWQGCVCRLAAICCCIATGFVLISFAAMPLGDSTSRSMSAYGWAIEQTAQSSNGNWLVEFAAFLPLVYAGGCVTFALFGPCSWYL